MNTFVIITSIFPPTEAIKKISELNNIKLIVVGDKKTPHDWKYNNVDFLSFENQNELGFSLTPNLPANHYCRKNIGYLNAISSGAEIIIDTDDDNIPYTDWLFPPLEGEFDITAKNLGFLNIYSLFTEKKVWPRGYPLENINNAKSIVKYKPQTKIKVGIWQGLADCDPDVDAIYRLIDNTPIIFNKHEPIVLDTGSISPFNSQNTLYVKELFALLYLPSFVSFRFTDILRGYVAQPIMWLNNYRLGFQTATVYQTRNIHNYLKDFEQEIPVYLNAAKIIDIVKKSISEKNTIEENLICAYDSLCSEGITNKAEMKLIECWVNDLTNLK